LLLLLTHTFLVQTVTFVVRPTVSYRALELDVPAEWLGVLAASFTVAPLGFAVVAGRLTDRRGERLVLGLGAGLLLFGAAGLLAVGHSVAMLVTGSVLLGLGQLLSMIGEQSVVAGSTGARGFDEAFGRFTFATSIGQAVGPALVTAFGGSATLPDTDGLFLTATVVAAGLAVVTCFVRNTDRPSRSTTGGRSGLRVAFTVPGLGLAILASLAVIASVDLFVVYLPVLGTEQGLAASTVGALLTLRAIASMASRLLLGHLVRRIGRGRLLTVSIGLAAVSMGLLPVDVPVAVLALVVFVLGLGLGVGQPLTMAWIAEAAPPDVRATALSLRLTGNRLGQTLVPAAVGLLTSGPSVAGVFWATAGALGTTAAMAHAGSVAEAKGRLRTRRNRPRLGLTGRSIAASRPAVTPTSCDTTGASPHPRR
jgi:MFS family permease